MKTKSKTDILFLCQFFYPEYVSSATLPFDTAKKLVEKGFTVDALCGYPKEYLDKDIVPMREMVNGIRITRVKYIQLVRTSKIGRMVNSFSFTLSVLTRFFDLRKYKYIIVYSNPPMLPLVASLAKKCFNTKFIFVAYDLYPEIAINTGMTGENGLTARVMNFINNTVYENAVRIVTLSTEMKDFIVKNRSAAPKKVIVIPNWYEDISDRYLTKLEDNKFFLQYKGKFVISYLGNMGTCQDMDTIIECIRVLKQETDIRFLIAGHGNKVSLLRETIKKEKLSNVDIYDFLQGDDYHDALVISDCSIVSLAKGITGLCSPSKVYGYMMAGNPIIAIMDDSDITNDISEYGTGYHIKNGDYRKMAAAILEMKSNQELLATMKKNCVCLFKKRYTTDICTDKYAFLFEEMFKKLNYHGKKPG